jgi:formylmethanofuran dehydrogenase subunit E
VFLEVYPQVLGVSTLKRCNRCHEMLPVEDFPRDKSSKDGLSRRCKPCDRKMGKQYRETHREHSREYGRQHYADNRERIKQYVNEWQTANPDRRKEYCRTWRRNNPEKQVIAAHARRTRKRDATGSYTQSDLREIRAAQTDKRGRLRCWWCGEPIAVTPHLDHKIALSRGGTNGPENLCYSCGPCNQSKFTKTPAEYAGRLI